MNRCVFLIYFAFSASIQANESREKFIGVWTCKQSYNVEGGLYFESEYTATFIDKSSNVSQVGFISLIDKNAPDKLSSLSYRAEITFQVNGDTASYQPLNIEAKITQNSLNIITPEFVEEFKSNRQVTHSTYEFLSDYELRSVYDNGETLSCKKDEL